jgi:hypothetical protein
VSTPSSAALSRLCGTPTAAWNCLRTSAGGEDWDEAAVYEALARAYSVAGDRGESRRWIAKARQALKSVPNEDDRKTIEADLKTIK